MRGQTIAVEKKIKYLGIVLDHRLLWNAHVEYITEHTGHICNTFASIARGRWGLASEAMDAIYNQIFVPIITYACGSWGWSTCRVHIKRKLIAAQRKALLHITRAYRTTPNSSLQVLARKMPIDKHISLQTKVWHLKWGSTIHTATQEINHHDLECAIHFSRSNHPAIPNKLNFFQPEHTDLTVYTDGSKCNNNVGSGFVAYLNNTEIASERYRLGADCTVFQAEMYAISMAVAWTASNYDSQTVTIITDSESSIAALKNHCDHPISTSIHSDINKSSNIYSIYWTRAHQGTLGNERADELAKSACEDNNLPIVYSKINIKTIKNIIRNDLLDLWQEDWDRQNHPITHQLIPNIKTFLAIPWYRPTQRTSQFLTNHGRFYSYLARFVNSPTFSCSLCDVEDGCLHYLLTCPMLELERHLLRTSMETHGYHWPENLHGIMNNSDTYAALLHLIDMYFKRTTVAAFN
ncbi:uncharacterized protein LOC111635190 [Centruroides sculpturatus]|uniref:uncharacterized protein LOC111635190 n=1 Tax=Centruroides sculpturatus TaxID=218467 RepID=UPI000C6D0B41|nr:uncharacterized protein LOC111635190 [Centruroides sculpturatus]